jgi:hypothetical protein
MDTMSNNPAQAEGGSVKKIKSNPLEKLYIAEYKCGCTEDSKKKKDLLNYCAIHGGDLKTPIYSRVVDTREMK